MNNQREILNNKVHKDLQSDRILGVIFEYMAKVSMENDLEKSLMILADLGKKLVVADRCSVWLYDTSKQTIWTVAAHGIEKVIIPQESGFVGHSIATGKIIIVEDAYLDERFNQEIDIETGYRTCSVLCIPFHNSNGTVIGAFQAINEMTAQGTFSEKDSEILGLAATYAGKSLESAILLKEIIETQKEMLETLGEIGESRSQETGNHVKRVALYSYLLAKLAGISEEKANLLRDASPMHDIGKVAIPDSILLKPGKLTVEEFEIMKQHTIIGYNIFKNSQRDLLRTAAIIAYEHHEKWDGTGYPNGLKGEAIHIFGRITAVADVFDALGSDRVYKKAWKIEQIVAYMSEQQGKFFDPILTQLFLNNLKLFIAIRDQHSDVDRRN
ncbi:HD domain-containing protein [Sporosarcina sp. ANT_H38]|uniref:HD domain-containing phosphohydrolase n=1 Tax=Sporosarcina sp. ANT_H38 TaxID=2597358 RepID=UPI0011F31A09|nr:HD domain-containing phosphohydrolase [Sporosarcina sp. ANT_H38]KAA0965471.1 HD domain-containing protein [Sporosarcina sp. ANT_H38]